MVLPCLSVLSCFCYSFDFINFIYFSPTTQKKPTGILYLSARFPRFIEAFCITYCCVVNTAGGGGLPHWVFTIPTFLSGILRYSNLCIVNTHGGGEGNRTPVRRLSSKTFYGYRLYFGFPQLYAYSQAYGAVASFIQIKPQSLSLIRSLLL